MKKSFFIPVLGFAVATMFISCGGGSKASSSGPLGEIPGLIGEFENLSNKKKEELKNTKDLKVVEKLMNEMKEAEGKLKTDIEAALPTIKGKEITTEIDPALPLKVSKPMKIEAAEATRKWIKLTGELELTAKAIGFHSYQPTDAFELDKLYAVFYDNDGKSFASDGILKDMSSEAMPAGSKVPAETYIRIKAYNAASMGKLSKLIITLKDSEIYKQAKAAEDALKSSSEKEK
ncbi:hypothetical protein O6P32_06220 [Phocaeicola sp. KGMB11183]|uniref:Lipoprotein n=1 Tax=Phocaeicola acetigenes TaxID=3016083 RepID=A0ABT4PGY2_9BACT|nr:hypothetical protein [Phocaeicola sp. KGMB11183]MCZ8372305.1 hypothetical protein [Phocaeicola sp. KGMB11183]